MTGQGGAARWPGYVAALVFVSIWASWVVSTRLGVTTNLSPYDLGFLRFVVPAIVLLPVLWKNGFGVDRGRGLLVLGMILGAGAPMFLLAATGMRFAPAAHVGALLPGTMPLFVALLSFIFLGERFAGLRLLGFGLIVLGILAIGGLAALLDNGGAWRGHLMFLSAAILWAVYTLCFRRSGLGPWHAAAIISTGSLIGFAPLYFLTQQSHLLDVPWHELAFQAAIQGGGSGLLALAAYAIAVRRLGSTRGSAFTSLVPALATLIAVPVLGELPNLASILGILCVSCGVALASGIFDRR